jgi:hypothetical protein
MKLHPLFLLFLIACWPAPAFPVTVDRAIELVTLPDVDGNGVGELAVFVSGPRGGGTPDAFGPTPSVYVRDSSSNAPLTEFLLADIGWNTLDTFSVTDGSSASVGVLQQHVDFRTRVQLYDAGSGTLIREIPFLASYRPAVGAVFLANADGTGKPGIAVVATGGSHGIVAEVRSSRDGTHVRSMDFVYYSVWDYASVQPRGIVTLTDQNGNGSDELAVLARVIPGIPQTISAVVMDPATGEQLSPYFVENGSSRLRFLAPSDRPRGVAVVADADGDGGSELAVLAKRGPRKPTRLEVKGATNAELVSSGIVLGPSVQPRFLRAIRSVDGNGSGGLALAAVRANGRIALDLRDARNGTLMNRARMRSTALDPRDLEVVPDFSDNGVEELALITRHAETGAVRIHLRDAATGTRLRVLKLP